MTEEPANTIEARLDAVQSCLPELGENLMVLQIGDLGVKAKSNSFDLLTKADTASEARLVDTISRNFPGDVILAEEASAQPGSEEDPGERFLWILDPIDGTTNFANRLPVWAVSIGLMQNSELLGGIVYAPAMGLHYRAIKGAGATCNGSPIRVNRKKCLGEGIIATGFPYDRAERAGPICRALENMLREAGGIRRLGAASLDFCFLADGRYAGYYEMGLKPWDYAAGSLIAREACATVTDFHGNALNIFCSQGVVATNGHIHEELLQATRPLANA